MGVPIKYRKSFEPLIASYDYTDLASGTGYNKYYLFSAYDTANTYHLGTQVVHSNLIEYPEASNNTTSFVLKIDADFDLTAFVIPQNLKGTALLNIGFYARGANDVDNQSYIIAKLKKNDVEIANGQGKTIGDAVAVTSDITLIPIVVPLTHFKVGDILRLTIEVWIKADAGGTCYAGFGIDPRNRDGTYIIPSTDTPSTITSSNIQIPFKINL